jgi:tetratricopeptide (TPR) repeat protein
MDEILEMRDRIGEQNDLIALLQTIIERQDSNLEASITKLEAAHSAAIPENGNGRLTATLERALALSEQAVAGREQSEAAALRLQGDLDRALVLLEGAAARIEALDGAGRSLERTLDRTLGLLGQAVGRAETAQAETARLEKILDRSLGRLEASANSAEASAGIIAKRGEILDRAFRLLDAALPVSPIAAPAPESAPLSWWRRSLQRLGPGLQLFRRPISST